MKFSIRRKPEALALIVALVGTITVLTVFLSDALLSRERELDLGERRIQHFSIMLAEHTARTFEAVDILLREMAADLSNNHNDWDQWESNRGWEYVAQRHSRSLPQLRDLAVFDREGNQRFISTYFPTPRLNASGSEYFRALEGGREAISYGPFVGQLSGRYTYALARRINDTQRRFSGIAFAAIEPAYLQDFCWSNRLADDFETVLINSKGQIVASCRPSDISKESATLGSIAVDTLYNGRLRGLLPETGIAQGQGLLLSLAPVPGFSDLRVLTVLPEASLLTNWRSHLIELGTLALLVTSILLVGGLLVRRQIREMHEITAELAASHETLETRILEATAELSAQKDAAERANTAKSRFLAAASHDLRQPLHALSLFAADLQRKVRSAAPPQDLPHLAEQISASTSTLGELLDSLLDISRLDVAGIKPEIRRFALRPMFERLNNSFRRAAVDRNISLNFRPTPLWGESDPVMIERMLANLISNALRYTRTGGRILVVARKREKHILLEVRDNGPGIATEHQAAIFAEFYQVGNTAREQNKGLGLGLSIVDRLARALKVEISLHSRPNRGTNFGLTLPYASPVASNTPAPEVETGPNIHFIGDSNDVRAAIELVRNWDFPFTQETTLREAALSLPTRTLIIVDAPLAAAASERYPDHTAIIAFTNTPGNPLPSGVQALSTPIRPAKLRALIGQLQKTFSKSMP
jgi:signal transduction histidine kinase